MRARGSASEVDFSVPSYSVSVRCQAGVAQKPKCVNPGKSSLQAPSWFPCGNATKQTIQSSEALVCVFAMPLMGWIRSTTYKVIVTWPRPCPEKDNNIIGRWTMG